MQVTDSSVSQSVTKIKVVMLGDHSTGKTSIISRFLNNKFDQQSSVPPIQISQATVGIDFLAKNVFIGKSVLRLQLWDTAGQERFRSLIPNYLKDAMVAILVFDVSNRASFSNLIEWFQLFKDNKHQKANIILVGNKIDLVRVVPSEEASAKAEQLGMSYYETSAKTSSNVEGLFNQVAKIYLNNELSESRLTDNMQSKSTSVRDIPRPLPVQLEEKPYQKAQKKRGCCKV